MRARLGLAPLEVRSAGTMGLVGHPIDAPSAMALRELGVDSADHVARRLAPEDIARADLVLTAESSHRSRVVQADPLAYRRVFTMREFGRLGRGLAPLRAPIDAAALRHRVSEVAARRGDVAPAEAGGDEIGDPFGASLPVARETAALVAAAVDDVIIALGLPVKLAGGRAAVGRPLLH